MAEKKHGGDLASRSGSYWVRHQHHEVEVVHGERPDTTPQQGERIVKAVGPFPTKEAAQKRADLILKKTTAYKAGKGK